MSFCINLYRHYPFLSTFCARLMFCMCVPVLSRAKTCQTTWRVHLFVRRHSEMMFPSDMLRAYIVVGGTCCQFASIFFFMTHHANRLQCIVCELRPACLLAYMCCSYQCGTCGCSEQPTCHLDYIKVMHAHIYIVKVFISDAGVVFNLDHSMARCLLPVLRLIISGSLQL